MVAASIATGLVFSINLIATIVLMAMFGVTDGVGTIYTGNCDTVNRGDIALHLLINVLDTALLGASNFIMQCLSSPTRNEVDAAHAKGVSLHIGVLSPKNLFFVRRLKGIRWFMLSFSTLPLHLLWVELC